MIQFTRFHNIFVISKRNVFVVHLNFNKE
ncbi:hypothetical protein [Escherichia phage dw-ec]|nr:hypothetical protein [Escherichia phage BI-EHEC]UJQ43859.1 hypothetical protein [Escherichia phage dw-ec]